LIQQAHSVNQSHEPARIATNFITPKTSNVRIVHKVKLHTITMLDVVLHQPAELVQLEATFITGKTVIDVQYAQLVKFQMQVVPNVLLTHQLLQPVTAAPIISKQDPTFVLPVALARSLTV